MKNEFINRMRGSYLLKLSGKHVERLLHKIVAAQIELLEVKNVSRNEVHIRIFKKDYEKIKELKTIYDISLVDSYGTVRMKRLLSFHKFFLCAILVGLAILLFLSRVIFSIEIVHTDKELRLLLMKELEHYGIHKYAMVKSFQEVEEIKKMILEKHKDKLEWLEIERMGTRYVVRLEERKLKGAKEQYEEQNIVASKSAIIKDIFAEEGVVIKEVNNYVKAGDVIISGEVKLNEELKGYKQAKGKVYGEVWYQTQVEYPYIYHERHTTGKKNTVYTVQFLNHRWEILNFNPFKNKQIQKTTILKHPFLPFSFQKEKQMEEEVVSQILTEEQAIEKAVILAREKIESKLNDKEKILDEKKLKVTLKDSKIVVDIFFTVYEDITGYQKIQPESPLEERE